MILLALAPIAIDPGTQHAPAHLRAILICGILGVLILMAIIGPLVSTRRSKKDSAENFKKD